MAIDPRLLDSLDPPSIDENFNRTLALIDEGGGGGGGVTLVHINHLDDTWYSDMTRAEIQTALGNGPVFFLYIDAPIGVLTQEEGFPEIYGSTVYINNDIGGQTLDHIYVEFAEDGTLSGSIESYTLTPAT